MSAVYQQAVLEVVDPKTFGSVRGAIESAFSAARVVDFFKSIERSGFASVPLRLCYRLAD